MKSNEVAQQWIPLTGPGGRLPTIEDASDSDFVFYNIPGYNSAQYGYWNRPDARAISFMPIPKIVVPPLPKPREKTQEEKDAEKAGELADSWKGRPGGVADLALDAIRHGRSDGRAQLAREALGLFSKCLDLDFVASDVKRREYFATAEAVNNLHRLLTKAADPK